MLWCSPSHAINNIQQRWLSGTQNYHNWLWSPYVNRADHYIFALWFLSSSSFFLFFLALNRGRHLYSAGRLARWALAHILVPAQSTAILCTATFSLCRWLFCVCFTSFSYLKPVRVRVSFLFVYRCVLYAFYTFWGPFAKRMPLVMEVGLGPGHIVLDGDPPPPKEAHPPIFGPYLLWPNGRMDQDATWYGGARPHCVRWEQSPPPKKWAQQPPIFRPMFIVAKRLDGSRYHLVRS